MDIQFSMKIRLIIFDLWSTLIYTGYPEAIHNIAMILGFPDDTSFWNFCDNEWLCTKESAGEFFSRVCSFRHLSKDTLNRVLELWNESQKRVRMYSDVIPFLEMLSETYKLVIVSNTSCDEAEHAIKSFGLDKYFDDIILSCDVGIVKPNPKIFQIALDRFNVKASEALLIGDDLKKDIIPARSIGLNAILLDRKGKYPEYEGNDWYVKSLKEIEIGRFC